MRLLIVGVIGILGFKLADRLKRCYLNVSKAERELKVRFLSVEESLDEDEDDEADDSLDFASLRK